MNEERFEKIIESLNEVHDWPNVYIYKFIFEDKPNNKEALLNIFSEEIEISTNYSRNGKYISITIKEVMLKSEDVLHRYKEAAKIEGIIAL